MTSTFEKFKKEKRPGEGNLEEDVMPVSSEREVFGEVQLRPQEETHLLEEIQRLKHEAERREVKAVKRPGLAQDDQSVAGVSAATTDDEKEQPIKYYGYPIPKKSMEKIADEIKKKLNLSGTWRAVWLTRLLQMS